MSLYPTTTGYKLYIGAAAVAGSASGLTVPGSDTFNRVFNLDSVKRGAKSIPPAVFYILDSTTPQSIGGLPQPVDWTGRILHDKALTPHVTMEADLDVSNGNYRNFRVDYPDSTRFDFVGFLTQWEEDEGKASGDAAPPKGVSLTIRQTGAVTKSTAP